VFAEGGDDIIAFSGGSDRAEGGSGADVFALTADFLSDGQNDKVKVVDYEPDVDSVDLGGATVTRVVEQNNRVILTLDSGDTLELIGVNDVDDVEFVTQGPEPEPNADPIGQPDTAIGEEDTEITGQVTATDTDEDLLQFVKASDPSYGTVTVAPDGSYSYLPAPML